MMSDRIKNVKNMRFSDLPLLQLNSEKLFQKVCSDATKEEIFEASSVDLSITKTNGIFRIYVLPLFL